MAFATRSLCLAFATLTLAGIGQAQIVIGSGRASGMGRAGLAVPYDWNSSGRLNPAIYGLLPSQFRFSVPGLAYRFQGLSFNDLRTYSGNINDGGLDPNQLSDLARNLGDENVEFGLGLSGSFFMSGFALDFSGEGLAATRPNASLQVWSGSGANGAPPADAQLDAYGVAGYETGFAYGRRIRMDGVPDASLGVRVKLVKSYYTHQFVDSNAIANNSGSTLGSEMGGNLVLSQDSAGVDLGLILSSSKTEGFFAGATIDNFITPETSFAATLPNNVVGTKIIRPYARMVNAGVGYLTPDRFMIAADVYDIFNGGGAKEFRSGFEYLMTDWFALRGGYASRSGFTMGVGLGDINLAYSTQYPGQFNYAFRF
ncbi:MAG: hypothetical protein R2688_04920 [Fimbriimonadaceae bacterium]